MRLISQNGEIDVPYEQCVIQRFKEKIYFLNKNLTGVEQLVCDIEMASYSSEEKAEKAMEMLREKYKDYAKATNKSNFFTMFDYPKVFQFPQDEDLEV